MKLCILLSLLAVAAATDSPNNTTSHTSNSTVGTVPVPRATSGTVPVPVPVPVTRADTPPAPVPAGSATGSVPVPVPVATVSVPVPAGATGIAGGNVPVPLGSSVGTVPVPRPTAPVPVPVDHDTVLAPPPPPLPCSPYRQLGYQAVGDGCASNLAPSGTVCRVSCNATAHYWSAETLPSIYCLNATWYILPLRPTVAAGPASTALALRPVTPFTVCAPDPRNCACYNNNAIVPDHYILLGKTTNNYPAAFNCTREASPPPFEALVHCTCPCIRADYDYYVNNPGSS